MDEPEEEIWLPRSLNTDAALPEPFAPMNSETNVTGDCELSVNPCRHISKSACCTELLSKICLHSK